MQTRRLGNTEIEVSVIGLGTVKFGRNEGVKYPQQFTIPTDKEIENLLSLASSMGVNLLDTAPAYGNSEERIGQLLKNRAEWIISSKVGEEFVAGQSFFDFSQQAILKSVERSLRRLKTDYLDILFIHSNGEDELLIKEKNVFLTLEKLKQAGKIRAFGMSTKTILGGLLTIDLADLAMVTFNLNYQEEQEVIAYAAQKQKGIFVKKALNSGHVPSANVKQALQSVLQLKGVTSAIIGTINPKHLQENMTIFMNE